MLGLLAIAALVGGGPTPGSPDWITLSNGVTLRYEERGDPAADPLILLHGYTDSRQSFELLSAHLPWRIRTIAIDLRGHGSSDRRGGYAISDLADDVVRFLAARKLDRVTLVGHSMGSLVAREVVRKARQRVASLVLIGSAPTFDNEVVRSLEAEVAEAGDRLDAGFAEAFQRSTVYAEVPARFFDRAVATSAGMPPRLWQQVLKGILDFDDRASLGSIRVPTLLMWGEHDAIVSRADQEVLLSGIAGSYLITYRDLGHAPHWENPAAVATDLLAFLASDPDRR